jgi:hypothetical protein
VGNQGEQCGQCKGMSRADGTSELSRVGSASEVSGVDGASSESDMNGTSRVISAVQAR